MTEGNGEVRELPKGWAVEQVGFFYEIVGGGTPSTKVEKYWAGSIPWITSADIHGLQKITPRKSITGEAMRLWEHVIILERIIH